VVAKRVATESSSVKELEEELESTEITLGTGKLLGLFVGLVVICAIFFSLGFALGKNSANSIQPQLTEAPATLSPGMTAGSKPGAGEAAQESAARAETNTCPEGQNCTQASSDSNSSTDAPVGGQMVALDSPTPSQDTPPPAEPRVKTVEAKATAPAPQLTTPPIAAHGILVQIAAVSKREDADMLVAALRKKGYQPFIPNSSDNLFHVQIGPFTDKNAAVQMKTRLASDGYNSMLK
jgi:DedD protein